MVPQPGNPQSFNRYAYGLNNPVKYVDPSGHEAECQSWDTTCWEDRYFNAQGLCRNSAGEYKRQCAPTMRDEDILEQTAAEHPEILERDDVQTPFDPSGVLKFIWQKMIQNAIPASLQSTDFGFPAAFAWLNLPREVVEKFGLTWLGAGAWDYKKAIRDLSLQNTGNQWWQQVNGRIYDFDVWTNIHFGFVGAAAGMSAIDLLQGAGVAQIVAELYREQNLTQHPPAVGFAMYDDPRDQAAISAGIQLWHNSGLTVKMSDIANAAEALNLYTTDPFVP